MILADIEDQRAGPLGFSQIIPRCRVLPLGSVLSEREAARAENNVLLPRFPVPGAYKRVLVGCMDLPFGFSFSFSTAGKSKSVKIYNDESECSPMDRDIQVGIRHGGWSLYGSEREGKR